MFSVPTDYTLEEHANIPESPVDRSASVFPVVLSMDKNDGFVAETVSSDSSKCIPRIISGTVPSTTAAELHTNSPTDFHTVKPVRQKFVIVGGVVQRTTDISKEEKTFELVVPVDSHSPDSLQKSIASPVREELAYSQRKNIANKEHVTHAKCLDNSTASDGWSTEDEVDEVPTPSITGSYRSDIYEMSVNASSIETTHVGNGITRRSGGQGGDISCSEVVQFDPANGREEVVLAFRDVSVSNPEIVESGTTAQKPHHSCNVDTSQHQSISDANALGLDIENSGDGGNATNETATKAHQYEIAAAQVYQKDMSEKSRPPTPAKLYANGVNVSDTTTLTPINSTASNHSSKQSVHWNGRSGRSESFHSIIGRVRATIFPRSGRKFEVPEAARKFIECGDMADERMLGSLTSDQASCLGTPRS